MSDNQQIKLHYTKDGYIKVSNPPSEQELAEYYSSYYATEATPEPMKKLAHSVTKEIRWLSKALWKDASDYLVPHKLLDYGSGTGAFANYMRNKGWDVTEYDLGMQQPVGMFSSITLMHVLEHVPDPDAMLYDLYDMLEVGGRLVVICPNDFSFLQKFTEKKHGQYWIRYPDHLNYFNVKSLKKILRRQGFTPIKVMSDFPMEFFLLLGYNYVSGNDGKKCHRIRMFIDSILPSWLRRFVYGNLIKFGIGRNIIIVAEK